MAEKHYEVTAYNYVLNNPLSYTDPLGLDTNKVGSTVPIKANDDVVLDNGSVVKSALPEISIVSQKSNGSDVLSDLWNSSAARSLVSDKLTVSVSSSLTAYIGFSKAISLDFITRGHDASLIPYVTATLGGQAGPQISADALINFGAAIIQQQICVH